jgi:glycosyltransferase involved in cell wall biosynthesis
MRICRVVTIPFFVWHHLRTQIEATISAGHEVHVVCSDGPEFARLSEIGGLRMFRIEIRRRIAPFRDLIALVQLYRHFRRQRYDIVHSVTPKAGLLAMLAARFAGVRVRLHHFSGQAWVGRRGLVRWAARRSDRLIVRFATRCYSDSRSQRQFLEDEGLVARGAIRVLGEGSIAGVDLKRFDPVRLELCRAEIRDRLKVPAGAALIVFVGRVTREKGIGELVAALDLLARRAPAFLIVVGPEEPHIEPLAPDLRVALLSDARIRWIGYSDEPERYLAAADVFCLPSYRESFGIVLLEAAALGVPAVATRIVGVVDAVRDGETGLLVAPRDARELASALLRLIEDPDLRARLGQAARWRAIESFRSENVNALVLAEYATPRPSPGFGDQRAAS